MLKNKKGSILDIMTIAIVLLFFAMAILIGSKISSSFIEKVTENEMISSEAPEAITMANTLLDNYSNAINNGFLLLVILLAIVSLMLAALVRIHPIFIIPYIIVLPIFIYLSAMCSNIYEKLAENASLATEVTRYGFMHTIMMGLPVIIGIFGIVLMVVMYKLWTVAQ